MEFVREQSLDRGRAASSVLWILSYPHQLRAHAVVIENKTLQGSTPLRMSRPARSPEGPSVRWHRLHYSSFSPVVLSMRCASNIRDFLGIHPFIHDVVSIGLGIASGRPRAGRNNIHTTVHRPNGGPLRFSLPGLWQTSRRIIISNHLLSSCLHVLSIDKDLSRQPGRPARHERPVSARCSRGLACGLAAGCDPR